MTKVCAFIGGSNVSFSRALLETATAVIKESIDAGFKEFLFSCYGNWVLTAASILRDIQCSGTDISLSCYVPDINRAPSYVDELAALSYFDNIQILKGQNIIQTELYLVRRANRILVTEGHLLNGDIKVAILKSGAECIIV